LAPICTPWHSPGRNPGDLLVLEVDVHGIDVAVRSSWSFWDRTTTPILRSGGPVPKVLSAAATAARPPGGGGERCLYLDKLIGVPIRWKDVLFTALTALEGAPNSSVESRCSGSRCAQTGPGGPPSPGGGRLPLPLALHRLVDMPAHMGKWAVGRAALWLRCRWGPEARCPCRRLEWGIQGARSEGREADVCVYKCFLH
jgi:hypothetical protein